MLSIFKYAWNLDRADKFTPVISSFPNTMEAVLKEKDKNNTSETPPDKLPTVPVESFGPPKNILPRLQKAFGPILGGLLIDFLDLATFGPIGIGMGVVVGMIAGYWVTSFYDLQKKHQLWWTVIAGIYCAVPFTEAFPFATLIGAFARYFETEPEKPRKPEQKPDCRG